MAVWYFNTETGLHYNRHRYYDPSAGDYLSPDPIGLVGGLRSFGYVAAPLQWVDPLGLSGCPPKDNDIYRGMKDEDGVPKMVLSEES